MSEPMLQAGLRLFESFDARQRDLVLEPLAEAGIRDWHYVPRQRPGLPLKVMSEAQRHACWALVEAGLGEEGRRKARAVPDLERILGLIEQRPDFRDPLNYAMRLFGRPSRREAWGWRFEGHHLSLTYLLDPARGIIVTPQFFGANRQTVPAGMPQAGLRILPEEEDRGFALVNALDDNLRRHAIIADRSPGDIITGPGREQALARLEGVALGAMSGALRNQALGLLELYLGNLRKDLASRELDRIRKAGVDGIHFAWAGALAPGKEHYYRLQGPGFVIEYENSQNDANHCHSVWHNPLDQFGGDLLAGHHHHHHHGGLDHSH